MDIQLDISTSSKNISKDISSGSSRDTRDITDWISRDIQLDIRDIIAKPEFFQGNYKFFT